MNIYELEKLATPGPIAVKKIGSAPAVFFELEDEFQYEVADIVGDKAEYDATLLAHCRNNFMKALEALKYMVRFAECNGMLNCHDEPQEYCEVCRARKVIAELEEVK